MTRKKVFISHATADYRYVPLLGKLVDLHSDDPWFAQNDLRGGDRFHEKIQQELESSDSMIVIVSRNTLASDFVSNEIATFNAFKPDAQIIPLIVDDLPPGELDSIHPGLSALHAISCNQDMLDGFSRLFSALGRDFLSRRELSNRRGRQDRREPDDRRVSSVRQRMSVGLLVNYTRHTGRSVAESSFVTPADLEMYREHVLGELERYAYDRGGSVISPEHVLDDAFQQAKRLVASGVQQDAVELLRTLSKYVCETYDVTMGERRVEQRRG